MTGFPNVVMMVVGVGGVLGVGCVCVCELGVGGGGVKCPGGE